jgi:hypothetical protein
LWVIIQHYPIYLKEGIRDEPKASIESTRKYWIENDQYFQFIAERTEFVYVNVEDENGNEKQVLDSEVSMDIDTVYDNFREWFKRSYPSNRSIPHRPTVKQELSNRWWDPEDGCWIGIRLKQTAQRQVGGMGMGMMAGGFGGAMSGLNMAFDRSVMAY